MTERPGRMSAVGVILIWFVVAALVWFLLWVGSLVLYAALMDTVGSLGLAGELAATFVAILVGAILAVRLHAHHRAEWRSINRMLEND